MPRILLAGIFHETHTFLSAHSGMADFERLLVCEGDQLLERCRGELSTVGGFIEVADELGWEIVPSIHLSAMPSGMVADEVLDVFWRRVERDLRQDMDAVFLILHGAMACESYPDVEGEALRRIHQALRESGRAIPIAGVLDLHGNFSDAMAEHAQLLVAYRENPHTDARETACRATRLLARVLEAKRLPKMVHVHLPMILPPRGTASAADPMKSTLAAARSLEAAHPELLEVSVLPGFAYADVPDCGFAICCSTLGDPAQARRWLNDLAALAWSLRAAGNLLDPPIEKVMSQALRLQDGPILLIEPSDNIGGGTPGDGTGVLAALLNHKTRNSAVVINDPEVAAACHRGGIGAALQVPLGGKTDRFHGATLPLEIKVQGLTDGCFTLENPKSHIASLTGRHVNMGPTATVGCAGITIIITSHKTPPLDLGQLRSQGVVPEKLFMIGVKAAVAHRAAYDPIARHSFYVDTPGLGSSNLKTFPYRHVRRPVFPLDDFEWSPASLDALGGQP